MMRAHVLSGGAAENRGGGGDGTASEGASPVGKRDAARSEKVCLKQYGRRRGGHQLTRPTSPLIILLRRLGDGFQQARHDVFDRDPLGVGVDVGENAVAEDRRDHCAWVVKPMLQPPVSYLQGTPVASRLISLLPTKP